MFSTSLFFFFFENQAHIQFVPLILHCYNYNDIDGANKSKNPSKHVIVVQKDLHTMDKKTRYE